MTWEYVRKFLPIEERPVNMTTASGERLPATLFTIEDVLYLPLSPLGQRIGYDASGDWLVYGRDERLFLWSEANNQIKSIRTPIETVLDIAPTNQRLIELFKLVNGGKLATDELPRRWNVPSREDLVDWLCAVLTGALTFENVSDLAADALKRTEDMHVDALVMDGLTILNGIDLQVEPGVYWHERKELELWIDDLREREG
ncbi:hypothetical protein [Exiguobacterium sp.]|uniref:hypothetical protein n=1 Tax=Exiguobacterium sp. TaxID=44751 RepID=UPI003919D778